MAYFRIFLLMPFFICSAAKHLQAQQQILDKQVFYKAIKSENITEINNVLNIIKGLSIVENEAYKGTLLMKKASLVEKPKEKLSLFKTGRIMLETAISKDENNIEYRFLRLLIQEHAPKITKYSKNKEEDSRLIAQNFKNLSSTLRYFVSDYSRKSTALKLP